MHFRICPGLFPRGVPENLTEREREIVTIARDSLIGHVDYTHDGTLRGQIVHELVRGEQFTEEQAERMADWAVADLCKRDGVLT